MRRSAALFLLFFFVSSFLGAQPPVFHLDSSNGMQQAGTHIMYFADSTGKLSIEDVSAPGMAGRFKQSGEKQTNFNISSSVFWVWIRVTADTPGPWCIETDPPLTNDTRLYSRIPGGWKVSLAGYNYPTSARELKYNNVIFPLNVEPGDTADYFVRMESSFPIIVVVHAGTAEDFWAMQYRDSLYMGIFMGIMIIMVLYNLFLFLTNRDRVYIYYVLYVVTCSLFISFTNGYAGALPDGFRRLFVFNHILFPSLFGYFALLFTMRFLNTKKHVPGLHRLMYVVMVAVTIAVSIDFFNPHLATHVIQIMGVLLTILCIVTAVRVLRLSYAPARYYLAGFGIYMLALTVYIICAIINVDLGGIPPPYILMAGSAIEAVILSFAIGDKLNVAMRDKQVAQENAVNALRENEKLVREQNVVLERKVEERTQEIQHQKEIIEEKNKDILSSIHYAKRIQGALLASDNLLKKNLPAYFVLYRPKDIVSGDFYWAHETGDGRFLLLAGDCTGHGVPGAFMSLLNISILHEITVGRDITRPDEVLNFQRNAIVMALNPEGAEEQSRDGMDAVLCSFDVKNRHLDFACANNPLWLLRDGKLIDYKADKQPIGAHEGETKPFTLQHIDLLPGDTIYLLTDGFADQFGGPAGKKFKYRQLQEKLVATGTLPVDAQKAALEKLFDDWRGDLEQVDDVLLIGIKIT